MTHVCLGRKVSDRCTFGGVKFKTDLGGQLLSACCTISVCMSLVSAVFAGGKADLLSRGY